MSFVSSDWSFSLLSRKMKSVVKRFKKHQIKVFYQKVASPITQKYLLTIIFLEMLQPTFGIISLFDGSKLLNENSTILHPLTNSTQNRSLNIEISDQMSFQSLPWWCYYSSDLSDNEDESECHCEGTKLLKIPQNLPQITRLSIGE